VQAFSCVIDANILLRLVSNEEYSVEVIDFLNGLTSGTEFHAPELLKLECANALRTRILRFKYPIDRARQDMQSLMCVAINYYPIDPLINMAFEYACQYGVSAYDAVYAALAEKLHLPLFTADRPAAMNLATGPIHVVTPQQVFGALS
jgi:predicted nucleic acid-binding protein